MAYLKVRLYLICFHSLHHKCAPCCGSSEQISAAVLTVLAGHHSLRRIILASGWIWHLYRHLRIAMLHFYWQGNNILSIIIAMMRSNKTIIFPNWQNDLNHMFLFLRKQSASEFPFMFEVSLLQRKSQWISSHNAIDVQRTWLASRQAWEHLLRLCIPLAPTWRSIALGKKIATSRARCLMKKAYSSLWKPWHRRRTALLWEACVSEAFRSAHVKTWGM